MFKSLSAQIRFHVADTLEIALEIADVVVSAWFSFSISIFHPGSKEFHTCSHKRPIGTARSGKICEKRAVNQIIQ